MARQKNSIAICPDGVLFEIDVTGFQPGTSFFVPCINVVSCRGEIRRKLRALGIKVAVEERIEGGQFGLRIWRKP